MRVQRTVTTLILSLLISAPVFATNTVKSSLLDDTLQQAQAAINDGNYDRAYDLYSQAAKWGEKGAQYVLGHLYLKGAGVDADPVVGAAWLNTAAEAPMKEYRQDAKEAMKSLSDADRAAAERLSARLIGAYGMETAGVRCKKQHRVGSNIKEVNCYHDRKTAGDLLIVPDEVDLSAPAS